MKTRESEDNSYWSHFLFQMSGHSRLSDFCADIWEWKAETGCCKLQAEN